MSRKRLIRSVYHDGKIYVTRWFCPWCDAEFPVRPHPLTLCHCCDASVQGAGWVAKSDPFADDLTPVAGRPAPES